MWRLRVLLISFETKITLKISRDYQRCLIVLYLMAIYVVLISHYAVSVQVVVVTGLVVALLFLLKQDTMYNRKTPLSWNESVWWLTNDANGVVQAYTSAVLRYDFGLFMRVDLKQHGITRPLIIFNDQLNAHERRLLHLRLC